MIITHLKYVLEVAKTGSISKASYNLDIAQPNLSRIIKDLEEEYSITIFKRTPKGMELTLEGEEFVGYAETIVKQIGEMESQYKKTSNTKQQFSISVPRASYLSDAFSRFTTELSKDPATIYYQETNSFNAINNILQNNYKLGIIRYAKAYDKYFQAMLEENGLVSELVASFKFVLVMNKNCPLAEKKEVRLDDLKPYIEIAHADPYVPSMPLSTLRKENLSENVTRHIFVFERASQFCMLSANTNIFMWVSPIPTRVLDAYGLCQRPCSDITRPQMDVLIHKKNYNLSNLDRSFIEHVKNSIANTLEKPNFS